MAIKEFQGQYRFLSNFWPAPVTFEGRTYPTVENAYQAAKITDDSLRKELVNLPPGKTKF